MTAKANCKNVMSSIEDAYIIKSQKASKNYMYFEFEEREIEVVFDDESGTWFITLDNVIFTSVANPKLDDYDLTEVIEGVLEHISED